MKVIRSGFPPASGRKWYLSLPKCKGELSRDATLKTMCILLPGRFCRGVKVLETMQYSPCRGSLPGGPKGLLVPGLRGGAERQSDISSRDGVTCPFVPQFLTVGQILAGWSQAADFKW